MSATLLKEVEKFCQIVLDHGRLSGGQMREKYPEHDPMDGYLFVERKCEALLRKIKAEKNGGGHDPQDTERL